MHRLASLTVYAGHLALLRSASWLVPEPQRAEWVKEWESELWHVRRACLPIGAFSWQAEWELTTFCSGAFQDAAWLRRQSWKHSVGSAAVHGSALHCVLSLCVVAALCALVSELLPGVRSEREATQSSLRPGMVLIGGSQGRAPLKPSISVAQYRDWKSRHQSFFAGLAFYRFERDRIAIPGSSHLKWTVAHASADVFRMMGVPVVNADPAAQDDRHRPQIILSQAAWRTYFQADPDIVGAIFPLNHRNVQIAGILPAGAWRVPPNPDLWLLESDATLAAAGHDGYVIARLSRAGISEMSNQSIAISAIAPDGGELDLRGDDISIPASGPLHIFFFALFLAVLALPAITSVSSSESHFASHRPSLRSRIHRRMLLACKLALIAAIAYFAALDIACAFFADFSPTAEFLQFAATFCICLFGLRWALVDQSHRCPVCLRHVTHPAQVGIASCNFLGWNGTEMICMGGHALLHVPSLPTSWFSGQRWMYLDTSWDFLFADTTLQP
jgi:hypothetical protein